MTRILAIARLTFREGVRMRIILVVLVVLALMLMNMPFWLRGDETVAGRLQNFLDYALNAVSICLGLATVFLSCNTLAGEIRSNVIHMVVTKPVNRFEILLGKWTGVMALNLLLILICGGAIYFFATYLHRQPVQNDRDRRKLEDTVWIARYSASPKEPDFSKEAEADVEKRINDGTLPAENKLIAIREKRTQLRDDWLVIRPQTIRTFEFEGLPLQSRPDAKPKAEFAGDEAPADLHVIQVSFKARGSPIPKDELLPIAWVFNNPETGAPLMTEPFITNQRSADTHSFFVKDTVLAKGKASLTVGNPDMLAITTIHFEGRDAIKLYYPAGSFEMNFLKAHLIILMRLAFLAALGLFFSTFVSFPVACFCVFTWLVICVAKPWWISAIGGDLTIVEASVDPYGKWGPLVRWFMIPLLNFGFPDFTYYDGTTKLVDGLIITNDLIAWTVLHTLCFGLALLLVLGWFIFNRREIAEVQL